MKIGRQRADFTKIITKMNMTTKFPAVNEAGQTLDRFTGKVLTCDLCGAEDSKENEVREWGNPYDWGVICEECDRHET